MKSKIILLMVLFTIFSCQKIHAQANCSTPPNCINNWGLNSSGSPSSGDVINSNSNTMLPNWSVFLGTPVYGADPSGNGWPMTVYLVSDATNGEGVFTCYNFRAGHTYQICISLYNRTTENRGKFILEAHNGNTGQIITNSVFYNPVFQEHTYTFTVNSGQNYDRIRVYTEWTNGYTQYSGNPYSIQFDDLGIVEVPTVTANPSSYGCGTSTLTASSTNNLNITWSPSTGLSSTTGNTVTASPCQTTTYTATFDSDGCFDGHFCNHTRQVTVNVQPGTNVTASPSTISCGSSTLTASSTDPMNVTWSPSTGLSSTNGYVVTASPCQTTTYTATFTCSTGCTYTKQVTVYVQPSGASVTASPANIDGCGSSTLTASSSYPMTVTWSPGTGLSSTVGNVVTATPCQTTTYTATFRCENGCSTTRQVTVYVQPGISVTASPSTMNFCQNSTLTASSTNPMLVTWSPSAGLSSTSGNIVTASPCKTTTYTATFYCPQNACTYTDQVTVNVQRNDSIANNSSTECYKEIDLEFISGTPCPGTTYRWYGPKGIMTTQARLFKGSSTPSDQGIYWVIVTTPQGCVDTFYTSVVMDCCNVTADFKIIDCNPIRFENLTSSTNMNGVQGEWHWDFGDGTTSSLKNPSHLYTTHWGPTTICLTAVLYDGPSTCCAKICKDTIVCDFGCNPKAAFDYSIVTPGTRDVQFTDHSVGGGTPCGWEWWVDGILVSTQQNPLITLPPPPPGGTTNRICLKVEYCYPNMPSCFEQWCEDIEIP